MSLREELLNPIAGANPGGVELRYDPVFDKIKQARFDDPGDPNHPEPAMRREPSPPDWALTVKLTKDALATKSKDLQVAAWLTEALLFREGFSGLNSGLDLLTGLLEQHWEHLFPEIEDGDLDMRAAPLAWIGSKLDLSIRKAAVDKAGHDSLQYRAAQSVPREAEALESETKAEKRTAAIADGKPTPEDIEAAIGSTPKAWFKALVADIGTCISTVKRLDQVSSEKFGDSAPSYRALLETLEDVQRIANSQLKKKLEIDPDPIDVTADPGVAVPSGVATPGSATAAVGGPLAPEPVSAEDATARIIGAARYLRKNDPFNPASYLLLRGFRWGELRASGASPNPKLLEAPPTHVRTNLKSLLLDSRWTELLEACETVMGTPQGRGWIDLQRYALTACDALGSDYFAVAAAMRGALKSLIADLPQLLDMTLMDDTPTANAETRAWLRAAIPSDAAPVPSGEGEALAAAEDHAEPRARDPYSLAAAEVRAGRPDRAISLLMREASREKTSRGRFLLQAQLTRIMVDAGHHAVAMPILEQLIADIENHKLEEWEAGEVVASPMALLYRVLEKTEGDPTTRQNLYLRICRLDPIQAMSFTAQG